MSTKLGMLSVPVIVVALILAELGYHDPALLWILVATIALISVAEQRGPAVKTALTAILGVAGFFIFVAKYGLPPSENGEILPALGQVFHAIHLDIFIFLAGLYLVVNTFSYSGIIGDIAWKIVHKTRGRLSAILVAIMVLTALLSGIFDGATIAPPCYRASSTGRPSPPSWGSSP